MLFMAASTRQARDLRAELRRSVRPTAEFGNDQDVCFRLALR